MIQGAFDFPEKQISMRTIITGMHKSISKTFKLTREVVKKTYDGLEILLNTENLNTRLMPKKKC